jgi:hypothetical protein
MSSLITADIHQTTNPREGYRWGLWSWLAAEARKRRVDQVIVLGDLTDKHDRHPARLVRRMVAGISEVAEVCPLYVLQGNHDVTDVPFFEFVSGFPNVAFFSRNEYINLVIGRDDALCLFLPSSRDPVHDFDGINFEDPDLDYVFMHQTIAGASMDNGTRAEHGLSMAYFGKCQASIYSGDIHVPQNIGRGKPQFEYVGAPYRVDFGDSFTPRVLWIDSDGQQHDLRYLCPSKHVLDVTGDGEIKLREPIEPGDQVSVRVSLERGELTMWPRIRSAVGAWSRDNGVVLYGPTLLLMGDRPCAAPSMPETRTKREPADVVAERSAAQGLDPSLAEIGQALVAHARQGG